MANKIAKIIYDSFAVYCRKHLHIKYVLLRNTVLEVIGQALISNQLAIPFVVTPQCVEADKNLQRDWRRFWFSN